MKIFKKVVGPLVLVLLLILGGGCIIVYGTQFSGFEKIWRFGLGTILEMFGFFLLFVFSGEIVSSRD
jgi:hypothetical protein